MQVPRVALRRVMILLAIFGVSGACARKPSREFDEPPKIPQAPQAEIPVEAAPGFVEMGPSSYSPSAESGSAESSMEPAVSPGNAPWGPTATYVPVKSPREIPGEKVDSSPSRPLVAPPPVTELRDPARLPAGTPFVAAPPPISAMEAQPPSP